MKPNKFTWFVFAFLAIVIGLYPIMYFFVPKDVGFLASKDINVFTDELWTISFYSHIFLGGLALLIGWTQFSKKIRNKNLRLHRNLGKLYIISVVISGIGSIYIGFFANGGLISTLGFVSLGVLWLITTIKAYSAIRNGNLQLHQRMMIYSYAACFAAVTLRIWLPILSSLFDDYVVAYRLVSWLCWVPNMVFAYFFIQKKGLALKV